MSSVLTSRIDIGAIVTPRGLAQDLANPTRYRTIENVPVFDSHEPQPKRIALPSGGRTVVVGASVEDLRVLARNSNLRVSQGLPPALLLGHTPAGSADLPESSLPTPVGWAVAFRVKVVGDHATLLADFKIRPHLYEQASTYPRPSVERAEWADPERQYIKNVALIRCDPDRSTLPVIRYAADQAADPAAEAAASSLFTAWAARHHLGRDLSEARRRFREAHPAEAAVLDRRDSRESTPGQPLNYSADRVAQARASEAFIAWCTKHHIRRDLGAARRRFAAEHPEYAGALHYRGESTAGDRGPSPERSDPLARAAETLALIEFTNRHRIMDPQLARARFDAAGRPGVLRYQADVDGRPLTDAPSAPGSGFRPAPETLLGSGPLPKLAEVRPPTAPAPPVAARDADRSVVTSIPNSGPGLALVLGSPAFSRARTNYGTLNRVYSAAAIDGMLCSEIRAGLLGYSSSDGRLVFPPAPSAGYGAATPSPSENYRARRDAHWSAEAAREAREKAQAGERAAQARQLEAASRKPATVAAPARRV